MSIIVTGHSDDLIEIDGDIREEFNAREDHDGGDLLTFSDGTVLRIEYAVPGVWRITPVKEGSGFLAIVKAPDDDEDNYTDRAELVGAEWVQHGDIRAQLRFGASR